MALPVPPENRVKQSRIPWGLLCFPIFIIFVLILFIFFKSELWPGGWGTKADTSIITTTTERGSWGNIIKTVETRKIDPGKTIWDWLSLLGVPITLVILGYVLQQIQQKRAEEVANQQRERDQKIAEEQRKLATNETNEEVLQHYFDRLSALLVDKNLRAIAAKIHSKELEKFQATQEEKELLDSAIDVIRVRTLSILRRFENDKERKTSVIRFLIEADFISKLKLNLCGADLSYADLNNVNLCGAIFCGANLSGVDLNGAILSDVDLSDADLSNANLCLAKLSCVKFSCADLSGAILCNVDLSGLDLSDAILCNVDLRFANLSDANLSYADLSGANLSDADLCGVDLRFAKFSRTKKSFTAEQIKSAKNWESALYDGKRLDDPEVSKQLGLDAKA